MFGNRYFGKRYFGDRYWGPASGVVPPTPPVVEPPHYYGAGRYDGDEDETDSPYHITVPRRPKSREPEQALATDRADTEVVRVAIEQEPDTDRKEELSRILAAAEAILDGYERERAEIAAAEAGQRQQEERVAALAALAAETAKRVAIQRFEEEVRRIEAIKAYILEQQLLAEMADEDDAEAMLVLAN